MLLFAELRTREYLTPGEVDTLIEAAKKGRHDATAILVAFRHGLRAAELCDLRWDQVDFGGAVLHVRRIKNGTQALIPCRPMSCERCLQRKQVAIAYVFVSGRGAVPFTTAGFTGWWSARRAAVSVLG
jgi:integrase